MEIGHIVILCFGLVFVVIGLVMMLAFQKGNRTGQDVQATVISKRKTGMGKAAHYFATLQYQINGQTYSTEISTDTISQPKEGGTLTIGIDPQQPEKVRLRRGKAYIVFYIMGGIIVVFAIILAVL